MVPVMRRMGAISAERRSDQTAVLPAFTQSQFFGGSARRRAKESPLVGVEKREQLPLHKSSLRLNLACFYLQSQIQISYRRYHPGHSVSAMVGHASHT